MNRDPLKQDSLSYIIHDGAGAGIPTRDRTTWVAKHNQVYCDWRDFWECIYQKAGSPESFQRDDFRRLDAIGSLFSGDQHVGSLCSTFFDLELESDLDHRYFHFFTPKFLEQMKKRKIHRVMSVEFLMILPEWRRNLRRFALSEVLIGLSTKIFRQSGLDALIGTARMDLRIHKSCYKFGFERIDGPLLRRNFEVELIALTQAQIQQHPDSAVADLIESLWSRKMTLSGIFPDLPAVDHNLAA